MAYPRRSSRQMTTVQGVRVHTIARAGTLWHNPGDQVVTTNHRVLGYGHCDAERAVIPGLYQLSSNGPGGFHTLRHITG